MLKGKKILLGVTGSIAVYKTVSLIRLLIKAGAEVKVIMTKSAASFVTPLTFSTISKNNVLTDIATEESWANHVMLGRWADIMLIAPCSCNTMAKMAGGLCDNLLLAVYLSSVCKVVVAPAMDEDMWLHPSTAANIQKLSSFGNIILPVGNGELASGLSGPGRMTEPDALAAWLENYFAENKSFSGKTIMVSAGPTYEPIDPVRFVGNRSSGKMGIALAEAFLDRGATVKLIMGPTAQQLPAGVDVVRVETAKEMYIACVEAFDNCDIAVMCAAVADYTPLQVADQKIKKADESFSLHLKKTDDILAHLGKNKKPQQFVVGFALETNDEEKNAENKLLSKQADMIIMNSLQDEGAGFGTDTNKITIFDKHGGKHVFDKKSKAAVAGDIADTIFKIYDA